MPDATGCSRSQPPSIELQETGLDDGMFAPAPALAVESLEAAVEAMDKLDGEEFTEGADAELDRLRSHTCRRRSPRQQRLDVLEQVRE